MNGINGINGIYTDILTILTHAEQYAGKNELANISPENIRYIKGVVTAANTSKTGGGVATCAHGT